MRTFQTAVMVKELTTRDNVSLGLFSRFRWIGIRSLAWPMLASARRDSRAMAAIATASLKGVGLGESWAKRGSLTYLMGSSSSPSLPLHVRASRPFSYWTNPWRDCRSVRLMGSFRPF